MADARPPVLLDLDGVVWLAREPIPGSVEAVAKLRAAGHRVLFVTNNSAPELEAHEGALAAIGIPAIGDVVTSAIAAATLVAHGERVLVCGDRGLVQAAESRGATVIDADDAEGLRRCDVVLVGFHRSFDYDGLRRAATAVRGGARLIGANDDATYPTPDGPIPGGGSILAAVEVAGGRRAVIAGKPYEPMAALVRSIIGQATERAVMVGDRPDTDGRFARRLGCLSAHVWSGVSRPGDELDPLPDVIGHDLADVVAQILARHPDDVPRSRVDS